MDAAFVTWDNNGSLAFDNLPEDSDVVDVYLTAAGVDTKRLQLFVGSRDVDIVLFGAALLASISPRPVPDIALPQGPMIQLKQKT